MTDLRSPWRHLAQPRLFSGFFFFFSFVLLLWAHGHWRCIWVQPNLISFILLYWLILSISPATIWTDLALDVLPDTFLFFIFFDMKFFVQCLHKTHIRSDLNMSPWKIALYNFALNYISEAKNKEEKAVSVEILFDCWPLRDLSANQIRSVSAPGDSVVSRKKWW